MGIKIDYFSDKDLFLKFEHAPCFSDLRSNNDKITRIDYYQRGIGGNDLKDWWIETLRNWGFEFSNEDRVFTVNLKYCLERTVTLMLLRYLDRSEGKMYHVIEKTKFWSEKFPEFHSFELFQLAHYSEYKKYFYNTNHTLFGFSQKIISLADYLANLNKAKVTPWEFGQVSLLTGSGNKFLNSKDIETAVKDEDVVNLMKLLA